MNVVAYTQIYIHNTYTNMFTINIMNAHIEKPFARNLWL